MRKIQKKFDEICKRADERNRREGMRFYKIFQTDKRYITFGIYDSKTKKWCTFDTINLIGNFRYNVKESVPSEFYEMSKIVEQ